MSENTTSPEDPLKKYLKIAISAFVSITHVIAFFQIVICSRHLAVAFNIPPKNIGIYFAKMYSLRSLLMSAGCAIEYGIFKAASELGEKNIRRYLSMVWFSFLTACEVSFLLVLYFSKNVAFHNYIVLNLEGMLFGFFQMSILSLIPEFASYYMLSLYVSGICIFIIQTIIDRCTKNSMLSVKIQSWICVLCSLICVGIWPVRLFFLEDQDSSKKTEGSPNQSTCGSTSQTSSTPGNGAGQNGISSTGSGGGGSNGHKKRSSGFIDGPRSLNFPNNGYEMQFLMKMTSLTILKLITDELSSLFSQLVSEEVENMRILTTRLNQITTVSEITYEVLVAIDLVILGLKRSSYSPDKLTLLEELSLFLRIKSMIKSVEGNEVITGNLIAPEPPVKSRTRRETTKNGTCENGEKGKGQDKKFLKQLLESLSQLMLFPIGSLVKDFLFPGVIPYGLLERDKCHLINLIVIIFLSVGPVAVFVLKQTIDKEFRTDITYIHSCWNFMIPKIIILIISLCAIHTKQSSTHKIRSSRWRVFLMTMILLTCYGFLETMSFVGMAHYVNFIGGKKYPDLLAIHNVFGKFFRYFVYKLSVGYNKTRISSGFVLPNFRPPEPIPDTFCYWFKGAFSNGWKDIKGDFKMGIKQYLAATQTVSKKSPLESLRYCDLLM